MTPCTQCDKPLEGSPTWWSARQFCSLECANTWRADNPDAKPARTFGTARDHAV